MCQLWERCALWSGHSEGWWLAGSQVGFLPQGAQGRAGPCRTEIIPLSDAISLFVGFQVGLISRPTMLNLKKKHFCFLENWIAFQEKKISLMKYFHFSFVGSAYCSRCLESIRKVHIFIEKAQLIFFRYNNAIILKTVCTIFIKVWKNM